MKVLGSVVGCVLVLGLGACDGPSGPQGEKGDKGDPGPTGPQGPVAGSASGSGLGGGSGYTPKGWIGCGVSLDLVASGAYGKDGITETYLEYNVTIYSNNDVEVSCRASMGSAQNASGYEYYPGVTKGASSGYCNASYDLPPVGTVAGIWEFTVTTTGLYGTYVDSDNANNGLKYTFSDSTCTVYAMSSSTGAWTQTTIAKVFSGS